MGSIPGQDISVWSLHVFPVPEWVLSIYSCILPQSINMQNWGLCWLVTKLSVGVNVIVDGCLSQMSALR